MKILSVVGARPQFIKAAPVCRALRGKHEEILVHTGQHYDYGMSAAFFDELDIPEPDFNLGVGSGPHGRQTGQMLESLEPLIVSQRPDWVLVYGDTNSTLAGALTAAKLQIPLAHVEAGLRSFNWQMPEEVNRVLTDRCSQLLFCPTQTAVDNLACEGIREGVNMTGDVMFDALNYYLPELESVDVLNRYQVIAGKYTLATVHRAGNTDDEQKLSAVLDCLAVSDFPVLLPLHPRTAAALERFGLDLPSNTQSVEPVSYLSMLALEKNARFIMTDSGGVQKEAYMLGVPCITLREETEWTETLASGWNVIAGLDAGVVADVIGRPVPSEAPPSAFGDGTAAQRIVKILESG